MFFAEIKLKCFLDRHILFIIRIGLLKHGRPLRDRFLVVQLIFLLFLILILSWHIIINIGSYEYMVN